MASANSGRVCIDRVWRGESETKCKLSRRRITRRGRIAFLLRTFAGIRALPGSAAVCQATSCLASCPAAIGLQSLQPPPNLDIEKCQAGHKNPFKLCGLSTRQHDRFPNQHVFGNDSNFGRHHRRKSACQGPGIRNHRRMEVTFISAETTLVPKTAVEGSSQLRPDGADGRPKDDG